MRTNTPARALMRFKMVEWPQYTGALNSSISNESSCTLRTKFAGFVSNSDERVCSLF
jgi:hypothetical protein